MSIVIDGGKLFFDNNVYLLDEFEVWFVVFFMGKGNVMQFVKGDKSFFLLVGVVVWVMFDDYQKFLLVLVVEKVLVKELYYKGNLFCFFLFLICSGFLVYVNGVFVVVVSR